MSTESRIAEIIARAADEADQAWRRVIVDRPCHYFVTRTWRERLFSWPWRPFAKVRRVEIMAGDVLIIGSVDLSETGK